MTDDALTELLAALHELTNLAEGQLEANGRLLAAVADQENPPTPKAVADARRHIERWAEKLVEFRRRLAGLAIKPPSRPQ